jgi:S-adenosylmethionine-dependent methyltransferase
MSDQSGTAGLADCTFSSGRDAWLSRLGNLRNVMRQELITRQLTEHLTLPPARILDVGAGQGTQAIRLAVRGYHVTAVEPDAEMRGLFDAAAAQQPLEVQHRLELRAGGLGDLARAVAENTKQPSRYDAVTCHGVLMYMPSPDAAIAELAGFVAPSGLLSVAARSSAFLPWRPLLNGDWEGVQNAFDELDGAAASGRDPRYVNEIGSPARADTIDRLTRLCETAGLHGESWYGVCVGSDDRDVAAPLPATDSELTAMVEVQERLGRTDPYRQLAALFHLVARRSR